MGDECDEYLRYLRGKRKDPSTPSLCKEKQVESEIRRVRFSWVARCPSFSFSHATRFLFETRLGWGSVTDAYVYAV